MEPKLRSVSIPLAIIASACMASCMSTQDYQAVSSGHVGCPPNEINIADVKAAKLAGQTATWQASCDGKTFFCAMQTTQESASTKCTERKKKTRRDSSDSE